MDLLIEKENIKIRMSSLGIFVKDINASNTSLELTRKKINGRNGNLFQGASYTEKKITVVGNYYVANELEDELMKDKLNGLFIDPIPYYITRMYSTNTQYGFELPGEKIGFDLFSVEEQRPYHYRYRVLSDGDINYDFKGYSNKGLLYEVSFSFITADIPFGITVPQDINLANQNYIPYSGTVPCSQLEWPWVLKIKVKSSSGMTLSVTVGDLTFEYNGTKTIEAGDVFLLEGTSFTLNGLNINDLTNIQYFILKPTETNLIPFSISLDASDIEVEILNKVDFYS